MARIRIGVFSVGDFETNSYLILNEDRKEGVVIDAPEGIESLLDYTARKGIAIQGLILTHGHIDHIRGISLLPCPCYMHTQEIPYLTDAALNLSGFTGHPFTTDAAVQGIEEGIVSVGSFSFPILHTPGHTPGGICITINNYLFAGDTLFRESVGRTDLPGGSTSTLKASIRDKLLRLNEDIIVYPGHGPSTTIGYEKKINPFLH